MPDEAGLNGWLEGHRIVAELGRERHVAARVTAERKRREWSQADLAKEMTKSGYPMPQSAISKFENPGSGSTRKITIDEAIAFSRLLDIPLGELVLPETGVSAVSLLSDLSEGPALLRRYIATQGEYEALVARAADALKANPNLAAMVADDFTARLDPTGDPQDRRTPDEFEMTFYRDVLLAAGVKLQRAVTAVLRKKGVTR